MRIFYMNFFQLYLLYEFSEVATMVSYNLLLFVAVTAVLQQLAAFVSNNDNNASD